MISLQGKKVAFLGDSITEGTGASSIENCYVSVFGKITGAKVYNYGIGATRYSKQIPNIKNNIWEHIDDLYFSARVEEMEEGMDYIVVFGGVNDFGHGNAPIGNMGDKTADTFYGACYELYSKIIEKYPNARIFIATPMHCWSEGNNINEFGYRRQPLSKYVEVERQMAELFSLPIIDLYANMGFNPFVEVSRNIYMPDGLHPSDKGHARIASMIASAIMQTDY